jgi:hypothetical protein
MTERIFEVEHQPGDEFVLRFKMPKTRLIPEASREHFRAAHKELLLSLRSLLDVAIERAEKAGSKERTKIEVQ